jgi:hypothetical protein
MERITRIKEDIKISTNPKTTSSLASDEEEEEDEYEGAIHFKTMNEAMDFMYKIIGSNVKPKK